MSIRRGSLLDWLFNSPEGFLLLAGIVLVIVIFGSDIKDWIGRYPENYRRRLDRKARDRYNSTVPWLDEDDAPLMLKGPPKWKDFGEVKRDLPLRNPDREDFRFRSDDFIAQKLREGMSKERAEEVFQEYMYQNYWGIIGERNGVARYYNGETFASNSDTEILRDALKS